MPAFASTAVVSARIVRFTPATSALQMDAEPSVTSKQSIMSLGWGSCDRLLLHACLVP
jgi:hypothetical protein